MSAWTDIVIFFWLTPPLGEVEDVKIVRGVHFLLDLEAKRVVEAMPVWTPGKQKGEPVDVSYTVPINFELR